MTTIPLRLAAGLILCGVATSAPAGVVVTGTVSADASVEFLSAEFQRGVTVGPAGSAHFAGEVYVGDYLALTVIGDNLGNASIVGDSQFYVGGQLIIDADVLPGLTAGQTYSLVEAERLHGDFYEITLPDLPGTLEFVPQMTDTELSLLVVDTAVTLPGDYNGDGCVDAADYTVWRDSESLQSNHLGLLTWRENYGRVFSTLATPIPEPSAMFLALFGATACLRPVFRSAKH